MPDILTDFVDERRIENVSVRRVRKCKDAANPKGVDDGGRMM
jgi:hypothetical protein